MKKLLFVTGLVFCFILTYSLAMADFYVIAGSKGVGTKITALPYTISSSGFYFIAKDLSCAAGSHGIEINADDVTLDLMGFSLIGPGGKNSYSGISMSARTNVEIRNGTVRDFGNAGIYEISINGKGHRIINIRVKDNGSSGIVIYGRSHLVEKCTATSNGYYGLYIGTGSTVINNTCYANTNTGIVAGSGSTVTGNTCNYNTDDGIYASTSSTVTNNTCYNNTDYGILLGQYCLVDQNTAYNNGDTQIDSTANCVYGTNNPMITP